MGGELKDCGKDGTREKKLEKLKINKKFHLETLRGRGTLEDLRLDEILKTM